jgi:hypothetical protein
MWLMKIVTRAKPRQKSISLGARMVYAKTFSRPGTRQASYKVDACPAASAAARPPDDGFVVGEIAAFDGFWQGRTLAEMHTRAGEIGAPCAGQW